MSRNHLQDRLQNKSSKKAEGVKRRDLLLGTTSLVAASAISAAAVPRATNAATPEVLPEPEAAFKGKISQTLKDSTPDFPKGVEAPAGAPNVLLILTDDVGFGASSTFGGLSRRRTFNASPTMVFATTCITRQRSARRRGRR